MNGLNFFEYPRMEAYEMGLEPSVCQPRKRYPEPQILCKNKTFHCERLTFRSETPMVEIQRQKRPKIYSKTLKVWDPLQKHYKQEPQENGGYYYMPRSLTILPGFRVWFASSWPALSSKKQTVPLEFQDTPF